MNDLFHAHFRREAELRSSAGGRVNLIGEHTDYHEGFVFPAAIDLRTVALASPRSDRRVRVRSENVGDTLEVSLDDLAPWDNVTWRSYVAGPLWALGREGHDLRGADVLLTSDVPFGGGLSSSASVQVCLVGAAAAWSGVSLSAQEVARIARKAENEFCHVPCGVMDQMASACGRADHAILLDCRSMAIEAVPVPASVAIVVADSGVRHALAGSEYEKRQAECASGMRKLRARHPGLKAARDLTIDVLEADRALLTDVEYRRLRHVVTEDERVIEARKAFSEGDVAGAGRLLWGSHRSLAGDYEVSCAELDLLVEIAAGVRGVLGARLTGAGFGGNTVNLVEAARASDVAAELMERYAAKTGRRTAATVVRPSAGVEVTRL